MDRRYLPVGVIVMIIGVGFILLPQNIEMHVAPELVTVWETRESTGGEYTFNTGKQEIGDVMAPYVKVWTEEENALNNTFVIVGEEWSEFVLNTTENPAEFMLPSDGSVQVIIKGKVLGGTIEEVNAGLYYLNPLPPEIITFYPYRFFGYGMIVIGVLASIVFYIRKAPEVKL